MSTNTLTISGTMTNADVGTLQLGPWGITNTSGGGIVERKALASGDNSFTIPSGTKVVIVLPPSGNTVAIKEKGDAADVGRPILADGDLPLIRPVTAGDTTFILNAAGAISALTTIIYL